MVCKVCVSMGGERSRHWAIKYRFKLIIWNIYYLQFYISRYLDIEHGTRRCTVTALHRVDKQCWTVLRTESKSIEYNTCRICLRSFKPPFVKIVEKYPNFRWYPIYKSVLIASWTWSMVSQVHDIYQTNPADLKRICLGILCFNTVNQWEIITQSSCREEMEK